MPSNLFDSRSGSILATALRDSEGESYLIAPTESILEGVIEVATETDDGYPPVKVLIDERTARTAMEDFIVASSAADLIASDRLEIRTTDDIPTNTLLVTPDIVMAVVTVGGRVAGLTTDDADFVGETSEASRDRWADANSFHLRTPPITRVRKSLASDVGDDTQEDFSKVLSSLETARGDGDGLDEVTISLLVAARNEELFYDVSKWGEDVGVASKATFSRVKNRLEDSGLITTEKVPVDVGRPRQRLTLEDDRLKDATGSQLASVAASILN